MGPVRGLPKAKPVLDDSLTGKPEDHEALEIEAQKTEERIAKQRGRIGDISIVGPGSINIVEILQEVGALPLDLETRLQRKKKTEQEESETNEQKQEHESKEKYDPLRPRLSAARGPAASRPKTPPWRQRPAPFVEDPTLLAKVFGHTDPTRPCRECLLQPVDRNSHVCAHQARSTRQSTSISLCTHRWLRLWWALHDPSNSQGTWQLVVVGEHGERVNLHSHCKRCESQRLPEKRCAELARRMVDDYARFLERGQNVRGPKGWAVKVVVPNVNRAEREIRELLLALKEQEWKVRMGREKKDDEREEREWREMKEREQEVSRLFEKIERMHGNLTKSTETEDVKEVEEYVVESVETPLEEELRAAKGKGEGLDSPPSKAKGTIPENETTTKSTDFPAAIDSVVALGGSSVRSLECQRADAPAILPVPETEIEKQIIDLELSPALPTPEVVLTESGIKENHSCADFISTPPSPAGTAPENQIERKNGDTENLTLLRITLETDTIPASPTSMVPEGNVERERLDAEFAFISRNSVEHTKKFNPPTPDFENANIYLSQPKQATLESGLPSPPILTPQSLSRSRYQSPTRSQSPTPRTTPLSSQSRSPSSPTPRPRKRSRTASFSLASLAPAKRPRRSLPDVLENSTHMTEPALLISINPPPRKRSRTASFPLASVPAAKRPRRSVLDVLEGCTHMTEPGLVRNSPAQAQVYLKLRRRRSSPVLRSSNSRRSHSAAGSEPGRWSIEVVKGAEGLDSGVGKAQPSKITTSVVDDGSGRQRGLSPTSPLASPVSEAESDESEESAEIITERPVAEERVDEVEARFDNELADAKTPALLGEEEKKREQASVEDEFDYSDGVIGSGDGARSPSPKKVRVE